MLHRSRVGRRCGTGKLGVTALAVLQAVANGYRYGFDIMDATGIPSGTVYPALNRLERNGLLRSRWEAAAVPITQPRRVLWVLDNGTIHRGQRSIDRLQGRWQNLVPVHLPVHASWLKSGRDLPLDAH